VGGGVQITQLYLARPSSEASCEFLPTGGTPEALVKAKSGTLLASPQILPDGKSLLYTTAAVSYTQFRIMVQSLQLGEPKELFAGHDARYLPTGHFVYAVDNN
jgi:hypothetical protein